MVKTKDKKDKTKEDSKKNIPLHIYNTLTRKKEIFKPIKKEEVRMYTCGPTVYWYQHIGNLKAYIFSDLLKRILIYNKYKVKHIINITDVGHLTSDADEGEDKMEKAAKKEGKGAQEVANYYFSLFEDDLKKLNILPPEKWTKATDHIKDQIDLIKNLEKKGYTYRTSDGIYFDSSKFKDYGKLAKLKVQGLRAGKRISMGEKRNPTDFALWKFSEKPGLRQQEWDSPWGIGFPGWHVECSAMSMKYLGEHFDLHTGGEDHIPVHHTNEIAQSEAATGKKFVNYWMHEAFLLFKGEKVSKSKGGLYTLPELEEQGYNPLIYRYLNLLGSYRKPLNFSPEILDAAKSAYERLKRKIIEIKQTTHQGEDSSQEYELKFLEAINNDLNTPKAIQVIWELINDVSFDSRKKIVLLEKFDEVLGLGIKEMKEEKINVPQEVMHLVEARERLRKAKMWAEADVIRERIKEFGYIVSDTSDGFKIDKI
ncbi:MAG: cysteine--tRNA ligase [Nanoarchaeota archaeon]|nr:cysteine--tRNA ligase [Nanoarchaeota archaeon]